MVLTDAKIVRHIEEILPMVVGEKLTKFFLVTYGKQGSYQNDVFVPWAKRKDKKKHKLLDDTGKMKRGFVLAVNKNEITISNEVAYAGFHNTGIPSKNLPKREFLYEDLRVDKEIEKIVFKELDKLFKKV